MSDGRQEPYDRLFSSLTNWLKKLSEVSEMDHKSAIIAHWDQAYLVEILFQLDMS